MAAGRILLVCALLWAQNPADAPRRLDRSGATLVTLAGGETAVFAVDGWPETGVEVSVQERQGMAGILTARAADGRELSYVDLGRRIPAARRLLVPPGTTTLHLRPANHATVARVFELTAVESRLTPDVADVRLRAERRLGDGERTYRAKSEGYLAGALAAYREAAEAWRTLADRDREADALTHAAYVLYEQGEMKAALDAYQRALDLSTASGDRAGVAAGLQGKALVAVDTGRQKESEAWGKEAIEIRRTLGDLRGQAETQFVLGAIRMVTGPAADARAIYADALDLARRAGDRVREADALNFAAVIDFQAGQFGEAASRYRAALAIDREEEEPVRAAQRLSNLGSLLTSTGELRESLAYLEEALPIRRALASPNAYGNTLYAIAVNHAELGEFDKALAGYQQALALFQKVGYPRGEGFVLRGLGYVHMLIGDYAKAEPFLQQAAGKWRAIGDRRGEVLVLNALGDLAIRRGDLKKAGVQLRQALDAARAAGLRREELQAHGFLAKLADAAGDFPAAQQEATTHLELARSLGDRIGEMNALNRQGSAWRRLGDYDRARAAHDESLTLATAAGARTAQSDSLDALARVEVDAGRLPEADARLSRALEIIEAVGSSVGTRESRMQFAASHRRTFELAIDVAMRLGQTERAFELSERARARSFLDLMREARLDLRAGVDPGLLARERSIEERLNAKHERLLQLLQAPHTPAREAAERTALAALVDEHRAIEAKLRAGSPAYAALVAPRPLSVANVQSELLDRGTALVEFWLGDERSYAWVVTRTSCRGFELPARGRLAPLATDAYRALGARNQTPPESAEARAARVAGADAAFAESARELSRLLLQPLAASLQGRRLWIVGDGELDYLPFAAIPLPGSSDPLIAKYEVVSLPSASVLAVVRQQFAGRPSASRAVAVFADPVFAADDGRVGPRPQLVRDDPARAAQEEGQEAGLGALPRLRFSREEAKAIADLAPAGRVWQALDFDASRAEARKPELGRYRVVHFATHGLLNSRHPELSGIVLSMVDRQGRRQDGFLRLHEVFNLRLNADLVVLSACETAVGQEVRSEGLISLVRGFMYAGSPQVVASLWSVRDRATAEFMRLFYEGLLGRKLSPEAALRAAQLSMAKAARWNQPFYWAGFTLQGSS